MIIRKFNVSYISVRNLLICNFKYMKIMWFDIFLFPFVLIFDLLIDLSYLFLILIETMIEE